MVLGVARESPEPSLFYAAVRSGSTLSVPGWFVHEALESHFELELWVKEEGGPKRVDTLIVYLDPEELKKTPWKNLLKLEVKRDGVRPDEN